MAIAFETSNHTEGLYGVGLDCPPPSGITNGDILVAFATADRGNVTISPPDANWNQVRQFGSGTTSGNRLAAYWKLANNESGNYVFTCSSVTRYGCVAILRFSGCAASPLDTSSQQTDTANDAAIDDVSFSTAVANEMIVAGFTARADLTSTLTGGSITERTDYVGGNSTNCLATGTEPQASAGATTVHTDTFSSANTVKLNITLALKPGTLSYTLTADHGTFSLTGQAAPLRLTRLAAYGAFTLSGQDATLARSKSLALDGGAFALTGQAAIGGLARSSTAGSFTLAGQAAPLRLTRASAYGAFTLSGEDAALVGGKGITADSGMFGLTGSATTQGLALGQAAGTFALTGQDAALARSKSLLLDGGAFTLTGEPTTAAILRANATGTFALAGQDAGMAKVTGASLAAATGTFSLTGQAFASRLARVHSTGAYGLTGEVVILGRGYALAAAAGALALTGQAIDSAVALSLPGAPGLIVLTGEAAILAQAVLRYAGHAIGTHAVIFLAHTAHAPAQHATTARAIPGGSHHD